MKCSQTIYMILAFAFLSGCQSSFLDKSKQDKYMSITPEENGNYSFPTWVSNNIIVFFYQTNPHTNYLDPLKPDLRFYNIEGNKWGKVQLPSDNSCPYLVFDFLQRLPDQNIGYLNRCTDNGQEVRTIREVDISTGKITTLMDSGPLGVAGQFSYSPDMSELVQEDMTGRFLSNKLFYRQAKPSSAQIIPNFTRAMYPNWSLVEREIAFWGTEAYSGGNPTDFKTLSEILALSSYPWDLYISTPEGTDLEKVLTSVKDARFIKWSPKVGNIAFSGNYAGEPGVWLVNPKTSVITRIWSVSGEFDWSPDGNKMVILDQVTDQAGTILSQRISIMTLN